ncbi:MAG TPA: 6-phosphofructokinase [Hungateiclostridium thermocellum]|jgi:6-phosphofructokinase|uniref:Pyrophosphate--fructose 6-phosphate 1-phosphotransferase n=2 Tax=Acetivibrio thermocellus TaxID=1515 RepID=A3DCA6_ACET2|nr:6-phosphofructokinase [Acetivibrio thermocellus]WAK75836.1 6-phosphofructokinase [Expression vector pTK70]ABN51585.1 phosphofructokinase [Acetivibrio thermocellus ATCC 27405]ADU74928.1 phosphofructokinase [Acetivibrio thermocellus DSM 1313]ALX08888.1 phosphofructokinase [Acetivibrio thermocellus AD2]ANV76638.1 phosphofructokinase [Acetivibrio thermocellus DSM 2360]
MSRLEGACIFGQSGGPTSVINASAAGVIQEALKQDCITAVYGAAHGIKGILEENFFDMSKEDPYELELLKTTPSSALGSVRYKLKDADEDETDYKRLLEVFKKYNIRYFFYNGGNDSMDTCNKVSKYMQKVGYECRVMGVPKTIDNDLWGTDHCPGYGSAAKYIATSIMEVYHDARVYDTGMITILEIMGRNAGWLTAAAALASYKGNGPDLIYLPELSFDIDKFVEDVTRIYKENGKVIVAVSEGIKDKNGKYISEYGSDLAKTKDSFGHAQLGGLASTLANIVKEKTGAKVRGIEFSLLQRCAAHVASLTDVNEAYLAGQAAVQYAVEGKTDYMVAFERAEGPEYKCNIKLLNLSEVANTEKKVPLEWIKPDGAGLTEDFIKYALPLIQGESRPPIEDGLPRFAKLKKVLARK